MYTYDSRINSTGNGARQRHDTRCQVLQSSRALRQEIYAGIDFRVSRYRRRYDSGKKGGGGTL